MNGRLGRNGRLYEIRPTLDRFLENVIALDPEQGECWQWLGRIEQSGYGRFHVQYRDEDHKRVQVMAHRWSYEHFVGAMPDGLQIDHLCRNRWCVNPDHLEAVTPSENQRRSDSPTGINARKTHCVRGHAFDEANTSFDWRGRRGCRACARASSRATYYRNRVPVEATP